MDSTINTLVPGLQLFTKDGRITGNGIIIEETPTGDWVIETDFGNTTTLTPIEVADRFWTSQKEDWSPTITPLGQYRQERSNKQLRTQFEYGTPVGPEDIADFEGFEDREVAVPEALGAPYGDVTSDTPSAVPDDDDFDEPLPARQCNLGDGDECESCT